ncbi:MAG: hypothetical protein NTY66_03355 [Candidatus Vogelbacteria bacterium]|nr:hypothetical protein [Candidatus Vogelbacteria bacterium]
MKTLITLTLSLTIMLVATATRAEITYERKADGTTSWRAVKPTATELKAQASFQQAKRAPAVRAKARTTTTVVAAVPTPRPTIVTVTRPDGVTTTYTLEQWTGVRQPSAPSTVRRGQGCYQPITMANLVPLRPPENPRYVGSVELPPPVPLNPLQEYYLPPLPSCPPPAPVGYYGAGDVVIPPDVSTVYPAFPCGAWDNGPQVVIPPDYGRLRGQVVVPPNYGRSGSGRRHR